MLAVYDGLGTGRGELVDAPERRLLASKPNENQKRLKTKHKRTPIAHKLITVVCKSSESRSLGFMQACRKLNNGMRMCTVCVCGKEKQAREKCRPWGLG